MAGFKGEEGEISLAADQDAAEAVAQAHGVCGGLGGGLEDFGQRHAEVEELGHGGGEVVDGAGEVVAVEIAGDGVGPEVVLLGGGLGDLPGEGAAAVADVEDDAFVAGAEGVIGWLGDLSVGVAEGAGVPGMVEMGVNVAGGQGGEDFGGLDEGVCMVDHAEGAGVAGGADGALEAGAFDVLTIGGDACGESDLGADGTVAVTLDDVDDGGGVDRAFIGHVADVRGVGVGGEAADHGDVDEGENIFPRLGDDKAVKGGVGERAGGAGIKHGGDAGGEPGV